MAILRGKTPDVTTEAGFYQVWDEQIAQVARGKRWCSTDYASSYSGHEPGSAEYRIPLPHDRKPSAAGTLASLPAEYLTDAGREAVAAQAGERMTILRRGAVTTAARAVNEEQVTIAEANRVLTALGIPELTSEQNYNGFVSTSMEFSSPRTLTGAQRTALRDAALAAVREVMAGSAEPVTVLDSSVTGEVHSSTRVRTQVTAPAI